MKDIMTMKIEKMIWIISFGIIGSVVSTILAAEPSGVVYGQNVTANGPSTNVTQAGVDSGGSSRVIDLLIDHAGGGFTSLQTDADNQTWIATGTWDLVSDPANAVQSNSSAVQFNATI